MKKNKSFYSIALTFSIIALFSFFIPFLNIWLSIVAITLSIIALIELNYNKQGRKKVITSFTISILALIFSILMIFVYLKEDNTSSDSIPIIYPNDSLIEQNYNDALNDSLMQKDKNSNKLNDSLLLDDKNLNNLNNVAGDSIDIPPSAPM